MDASQREEGDGRCQKAAALLERLRDVKGVLPAVYFLEAMQELTQALEEENVQPHIRPMVNEFLRHARRMPQDRFLSLLQAMRQALQWGDPEGEAARAANKTCSFIVREAWCYYGGSLAAPQYAPVLQLCRDHSLDVGLDLRCELLRWLAARCCWKRKHERLWTSEHMDALVEGQAPEDDDKLFHMVAADVDHARRSPVFLRILDRLYAIRNPLLEKDARMREVYEWAYQWAGFTGLGGEPRELFAFVLNHSPVRPFGVSKRALAFINERRVARQQEPMQIEDTMCSSDFGDCQPSAGEDLKRSDPDLIEAVRALGRKRAGSKHTDLRIRWAPRDMFPLMEIDKTSGKESVSFRPPPEYFDFEEEASEDEDSEEDMAPSCSWEHSQGRMANQW